MKPLFLLSACGAALLGLSACGPTTPATARVALDCPSSQGDLKLSTEAPDKKTCTYASRNGDEVSLRLIPVSTTYEAALLPIETELQGEQQVDQAATGDAKDTAATVDPKTAKAGAADAAKAAKEAASDALNDTQKARKDDENDHVSVAGEIACLAGRGDCDNPPLILRRQDSSVGRAED